MHAEKQAVLNSVFAFLIKYSGDEIKEDGIDGACAMYVEG
jgi:hypothetical protein